MRWAASVWVLLLLSGCGALEESTPPSEKPTEAPTETDRPETHVETVLAWQPRPDDPARAEHPIEDPTGGGLEGFYAALARTEARTAGALTRVTHMGDSSIGMDQLPHYLRTRFQERFGDGGAGFVLLQPHSPNYRNRMVHLATPVPWDFCFLIYQCRRDGHYGLGGVSAESRGGATTLVRTRREGAHGSSAWGASWRPSRPRGGDGSS